MLYWLLFEKLQPVFGPFRLFGYVTFRTAFALITALLISLLLGPWMIRKLRHLAVGQFIRDEGPQSHQTKAGTPTMGGLLIVISILVPTLLWANLRNVYVWIALSSLLGFGAIGFYDDYTKLRKMRNLGLTARRKFLLQVLVAMAIGFCLLLLNASGQYTTAMNVPSLYHFTELTPMLKFPFFKDWSLDLGLPFIPFSTLVIVGASNAVNLTDGLDGLAAGSSVLGFAAYTLITFWQYRNACATSPGLGYYNVRDPLDLALIAAATAGACTGFLWWNAAPAQIFMGDTGSLAMGGLLATVAVCIRQEVLLVVIGGVFYLEALSVILQVGWFKWTRMRFGEGRRILLCAPAHHHFQHAGWKETQVVGRFYLVAITLAILALVSLKLR